MVRELRKTDSIATVSSAKRQREVVSKEGE